MRRRRVFLVLIAAVVLVVVGMFVAGAFREREPEYGGKRLSEWVVTFEAPTPDESMIHTEEAVDAIRHIGTHAIPYLLKWIRYERSDRSSGWKSKLDAWLEIIHRGSGFTDQEDVRANGAMRAFRALGPEIGRASCRERV